MAEAKGRKPTCLQRIIQELHERDFLTADLIMGLRDWSMDLKMGLVKANAQTREQAIARTIALMKGLDDPKKLAEGWVNMDGSVSPNSEAGLRARLSDEMALCLRRGGVLTPSGEIRRDIAPLIEEEAYGLRPELRVEVQLLLEELGEGEVEGRTSTLAGGNFSEID